MKMNRNDSNISKRDKIIELAKRELARRDFWEFCLYMDRDFFETRKTILKSIAQDMQRLVKPIPPQRELDVLNISLPPRTGKSYLTTLLCGWLLGHNPRKSIMRNSVTQTLYNKFSKDLLHIMIGESHGNRYSNIFQVEFNSQSVTGWELSNSKQGITYFGGGVGGTIIGFGADLLSILDDSVKNEQEALNESKLDSKWGWYTSTMDSREEQGVKKLFIGTRWAKKDIIGMLENYGIFDGDDAKSIVIPSLINGKSYCEAIHTTESLLKKKKITSDIIWESEWMQKPISAKGLVFPMAELKRFSLDNIEDRTADLMLADLADEGTDYLSAGVVKKVDDEFYVLDVVFDNQKEEVTQPLVAKAIDDWEVATCYLESNFGGKGYKSQLEQLTRTRPSIELFKTTKNKHTKIIMESGFIREHFHFRNDYEEGSDYDKFMNNLTSYNKQGKVNHDDGADMMAMISEQVRRNENTKLTFGNKSDYGF